MPGPRSLSIFSCCIACVAAVIILLTAHPSYGDSFLLFKEAQLVFGADNILTGPIFYSQDQDDVMQKPSIGMDYIYRFSDDAGDKAVFALQGRLAWNESYDRRKIEPQLYNAYFKIKNQMADIWLGHSRPAYGLSSYFDSHALLLPTLGMMDLGFDRDWGIGLARDTDWGDIALSATTGSGMPLYAGGNGLFSGRISYGVLNRDNFNLGLSKASGKLLTAMGYEYLSGSIYDIDYTGIDAALLYDNYELRGERTWGGKRGQSYNSYFVRAGIKLLEEEDLKIELQLVGMDQGNQSEQVSAACITYILDENLAFRSMYQHSRLMDDNRLIFQCYYYSPW
ncbi:MAG: hypothetical protein V1843_03935 [bacterium]